MLTLIIVRLSAGWAWGWQPRLDMNLLRGLYVLEFYVEHTYSRLACGATLESCRRFRAGGSLKRRIHRVRHRLKGYIVYRELLVQQKPCSSCGLVHGSAAPHTLSLSTPLRPGHRSGNAPGYLVVLRWIHLQDH